MTKVYLEKLGMKFRLLNKVEPIPYHLLLLADPEKKLVDDYLNVSTVFIAEKGKETIGIIVLMPLTEELVEIKNVAVDPELQGQGIGKYLIENTFNIAIEKGYKQICIGTANSSIGQIYLYQKLGFELNEIKPNFFIDNYAENIYENGIQAKHMLMFTRQL